MSKTTKVISLSVPPELDAHLTEVAALHGHNNRSKIAVDLFGNFLDMSQKAQGALRAAAEKRNTTVAELIEFLVDKFPLEDDSVRPIVLRVPVNMMQDPVTLESWLNQKVTALVNHLHS